MANLDPLRRRIRDWRAAKIAEAGITPLRYPCRADAPRLGWVVWDGEGFIVTKTSRPAPNRIACAVLVGLHGDRPIWAVYDEGPA